MAGNEGALGRDLVVERIQRDFCRGGCRGSDAHCQLGIGDTCGEALRLILCLMHGRLAHGVAQ